ncbi:iron-containing alcohol dehydrogenase [Alistipes finegoldii]|uniref:iron-containing alcohol dehydrogenase n=1 Tax=Alistipes finegoldii TaxID=214856 RepID=UPI00336569DA
MLRYSSRRGQCAAAALCDAIQHEVVAGQVRRCGSRHGRRYGGHAAQAAVDAVRTLAVRVGIPQRLSSLGVREEDLPRLAASALADVCTPGNPRDTSAEEILALYREAF